MKREAKAATVKLQPPHAHIIEKLERQNDGVFLIFKEKKIKIPIFKEHLIGTHYPVITLKNYICFPERSFYLNNKKKRNERVQ